MAWQNEMVRIVRNLINDHDTSDPTYSNERLEEVILVSAQLVQNEIDFDTVYSIDVDAYTLSPDPTENTRDNNFVNLICLRSALLILGSEYKTNSSNSVRVTDGPSSIDMTDVTRNSKLLYEQALSDYTKAKVEYKAGNGMAGHAILGPYTYEGIAGYYSPN